jgi:hypothetical protein
MNESMSFAALHAKLANRTPIEEVPIDWDNTLYTSAHFNAEAAGDDFYEWPGDYPIEREVSVIAQLLTIQPRQKLLDIACGFGRHSPARKNGRAQSSSIFAFACKTPAT